MVHDLVNVGQGVGILDGNVIEFPVVDYWVFCPILLSDKEDWGCSGASCQCPAFLVTIPLVYSFLPD